jgi:hypothetical protein
MRVTCILYNRPGKGEFYRKHFDMPDEQMPTTPDEFATRSLNAVRHSWPETATGKAISAAIYGEGKRYVVEGHNWSVEWSTDAHMADVKAYVDSYMDGKIPVDEYMAYLMRNQPERTVSL